MTFMEKDHRSIALSVSDAIGAEGIRARVEYIRSIASMHPIIGSICIRNDSGSAERLIEATGVVSESWNGKVILQSDDVASISRSMVHLIGRDVLILCTNPETVVMADIGASALGASLAVTGNDVESLVSSIEGLTSEDIILVTPADDMKSCKDNIEDVVRLACDHSIPEADHPLAVIVKSGEYALTVASVAFHTGASLVVFDDMYPLGCELLGMLSESL